MVNRSATRRIRAEARAIAVFCILCIVSTQKLYAGDDWTIEQVIEVIASREEAVNSVDVTVKKTEAQGHEFKQYSLASKAYNEAMARFYRLKLDPRPALHESTVVMPAPTYCRYRADSSGQLRIDWLEDGDNLESVSESLYFDGQTWQTFVPRSEYGPHVIIDSPSTLAEYRGSKHDMLVAQALGLSGPLWAFGACPYPQQPIGRTTISGYIREALRMTEVVGPKSVADPDRGNLIELTLLHSMEKKYPNASKAIYLEVAALLDGRRGLAPVEVRTRWVCKVGDGYQEMREGPGFKAVWEDFSEVVPGVWLPKACRVRGYFFVTQPNGDGFRPLLKDGKPVTTDGSPVPDMSDARAVNYCISEDSYVLDNLQVNTQIDEPLCEIEYPAGTVVTDRIHNEQFQLTGVSPAIDAKLKRMLQPGGVGDDAGGNEARVWRRFLIGAAFLMLAIVGICVLYRRRRKLASSVAGRRD